MDDPETLASALERWQPRTRIGAWLQQILAESHARTGDRRARVLAHEDLREALTQPPVAGRGLAFPEAWNGYVPPYLDQSEGGDEPLHAPHGLPNKHGTTAGRSRHNTSPERAALVYIAGEAWKRAAAAGQIDPAAKPPDLLAEHPFPLPGLAPGPEHDRRPEFVVRRDPARGGNGNGDSGPRDFTEPARSPHNQE